MLSHVLVHLLVNVPDLPLLPSYFGYCMTLNSGTFLVYVHEQVQVVLNPIEELTIIAHKMGLPDLLHQPPKLTSINSVIRGK